MFKYNLPYMCSDKKNYTEDCKYVPSFYSFLFHLIDHDCIIITRIARTPAHKEKQAHSYIPFEESIKYL